MRFRVVDPAVIRETLSLVIFLANGEVVFQIVYEVGLTKTTVRNVVQTVFTELPAKLTAIVSNTTSIPKKINAANRPLQMDNMVESEFCGFGSRVSDGYRKFYRNFYGSFESPSELV